ncbi:hypothetical protein [Candidatus Phytoplasma pruni]|uniref:Uncharacterized protein n=1 Tax=Candidatus Phytoplasma pruni TaxID=479893 RepID=A0A851HIW3_9MOLU|nr:hypothetical protein [Candidatus Phytoplasma pruni]NWN45763.1 hypothetical protein [Candidatus Phytoplasma pruni]
MIKKTMKNGNIYHYYPSGKIKIIMKNGDIKWYTKQIYYPKKQSSTPPKKKKSPKETKIKTPRSGIDTMSNK